MKRGRVCKIRYIAMERVQYEMWVVSLLVSVVARDYIDTHYRAER